MNSEKHSVQTLRQREELRKLNKVVERQNRRIAFERQKAQDAKASLEAFLGTAIRGKAPIPDAEYDHSPVRLAPRFDWRQLRPLLFGLVTAAMAVGSIAVAAARGWM